MTCEPNREKLLEVHDLHVTFGKHRHAFEAVRGVNFDIYKGETFGYDSNVEFPVTVDDDSVFVMGDNRPQSKDSRSSELGQVPIKAIMGKCSLRIWPINKLGNPDVTE